MAIKCVRPTAEIFYGLSLFTFAFNAITLPQIVQHKVCFNRYNSTICGKLQDHPAIENDVQARAASWMSIVPLSALLPGLVMVLIIGPLSDVIGKKRTMIIPPAIYFIQSLVFILLSMITRKFSPAYFLLAYCLTGLFGDNSGCILLSQAYISSITTKDNRTIRMTLLESALFLGGLLAAISSGFILSRFGFTGGFTTTATINFINLIYVVFFLPPENLLAPCPASMPTPKDGESTMYTKSEEEAPAEESSSYQIDKRVPNREGQITLEELNPIAGLRRISEAICTKQRRSRITAILALCSIAWFANMGEVYMGVLFLKHRPFNLKFKDIGYLLALQNFLRALGLVTIPYICQKFFKFKDIHFVMLGFCTQIAYFTSLGFANSVKTLFFLQLVSMPVAIHLAVFRSMVSKLVDPDQYGAATAALEVADIASSLVTSLLSNQIYSATVRIFSGFAVTILGIVAVPGLIGAVVFSCVFKDREALSDEQKRLLASADNEEETEFTNK